MARALASALVVFAFVAAAPPVAAAGFCTMLWAPVCALKDDATVIRQGPCEAKPAPPPSPRSVFRTDEYAPVCGVKNDVARMYPNRRRAFADGATVANLGKRRVKQ